jgi:hypothetical protein
LHWSGGSGVSRNQAAFAAAEPSTAPVRLNQPTTWLAYVVALVSIVIWLAGIAVMSAKTPSHAAELAATSQEENRPVPEFHMDGDSI